MADSDGLAAAFEEHRDHLRAVAYRLLGSMTDADDAVQDTWLRLTGADTSEVENLGGCQPVAVGHLSRSLVAWCHHTDTRRPPRVTCGGMIGTNRGRHMRDAKRGTARRPAGMGRPSGLARMRCQQARPRPGESTMREEL